MKLINTTKSHKLLGRGCKGFLCNVVETDAVEPSLQDILIVREFPAIFPEEILGMPPIREVEVYIDLVLGTTPISKGPYRMAPVKLKELKTLLDELLEKGYIQPSTSVWGAPV